MSLPIKKLKQELVFAFPHEHQSDHLWAMMLLVSLLADALHTDDRKEVADQLVKIAGDIQQSVEGEFMASET